MSLTGAAQTFDTGSGSISLFELTGAPTGANNIVVTLSGAVKVIAGGVSLLGVSQGTPTKNYNSAQGSGTTPTVDITVTSGDTRGSWVIDAQANGATSAASPGDDQTERMDKQESSSALTMSTEVFADTASSPVTMDWTISSGVWGIAGAEVVGSRRHVLITHN